MELKKRMPYEEMAEHFENETGKIATKSSVGKFARKLGYEIYKPRIGGINLFFYVNPNLGKKTVTSE